MKKIIMMLTALLAISLSACSQKKTETKMEQKVLVAYFSATGTTKAAARQLAEVLVLTCMKSSRNSPILMRTWTGRTSKAVRR